VTRYILLGIVTLSLFAIAPYFGFFSQSSLVLSETNSQTKGFFDEMAEAGEKIADIDEKAENIRRAGEEFVDDVKEDEE
jgi:hypothetical protein